jgi:hypothetical protein
MSALPTQIGWYAVSFPDRGGRVVFCYPEGGHVVAEVRDGHAPALRALTDLAFSGTTWTGPFNTRQRAHDALEVEGGGNLGDPTHPGWIP